MAQRIVEAGYPTTLYARRPATLAPFEDGPVEVAGSLVELGASSDVVGVCVVDDADVAEVVRGPGGLLEGASPGTVIAVHSTVHPRTCRDLAKEAAARGVVLIDAPVSGGGVAAAAGRLLVMVGADEPTFARSRPVFSTYGDPVLLMGPVGTGQVTKLVNNMLMLAHLATADDAFALGASLGLGTEPLTQAFGAGSGRSFALGLHRGRALLPAALLGKDLELARAVVTEAGLEFGPLLEAASRGLALIVGAPPSSSR